MNKKPPTIRSIDEKSLHRIRARSKGKPTFADCYPDRKALGCLNPGAETLQLNEVLPGSKVYFRWICNKNSAHKWNGTPNNRTKYHCPHCYAEEKSAKVRRGKTNLDNLLKDKFPEHFAQLEVALDSKGNELDKNYLGAKSFAKGIWNWHSPKSVDKYDVKTEMENLKCKGRNTQPSSRRRQLSR